MKIVFFACALLLCQDSPAGAPSGGWDDQFYRTGFDYSNFYPGSTTVAATPSKFYVSGGFFIIGGKSIRALASWDGHEWSPVFDPPLQRDPNLLAIATRGEEVFVGGTALAFATTNRLHNVALWNGRDWSDLGGGVDGTVAAISVSGELVYVGGTFNHAGNVAATNIACWNGSNWTALGTAPFAVTALAVHEGSVIAGGKPAASDPPGYSGLASWNGSAWLPMAGGITNPTPYGLMVRSLVSLPSGLYAAGSFLKAGSATATNLARWTGNDWESIGGDLGSIGHFFERAGVGAPPNRNISPIRGSLLLRHLIPFPFVTFTFPSVQEFGFPLDPCSSAKASPASQKAGRGGRSPEKTTRRTPTIAAGWKLAKALLPN